MTTDLSDKSMVELLALHVAINDEMRRRNFLRSANGPTGDLAETLFCNAFGWKQEPNSTKAFDAKDHNGLRYQIKARRLHSLNASRLMSAIRDFEGFDFLAAVLFNADYSIYKAALIPTPVVKANCGHSKHTNSHRFILRDKIFIEDGVVDVTDALRVSAQAS